MRRLPVLLAALLLLPACAFDGYRYRYEPKFATTESHGARLMVTVLGAQYGQAGALDTMHVRFRNESPAGTSARVLPESLRLLSGDLRDFGPAQVQQDSSLETDGSAAALGDIAFPFPDGDDVDVNALSLSWTFVVAGEATAGTATFVRSWPTYSPYADPRYATPWYGPGYGPWGSPWYGPAYGPWPGAWYPATHAPDAAHSAAHQAPAPVKH